MTTYISHRLTMGKAEIGSFCCFIGDIRIFFSQIYLLSSSLCSICFISNSLNLIGWQGDMKGKFSFSFFKNLHFRTHKEDGAEIWPTCLGH